MGKNKFVTTRVESLERFGVRVTELTDGNLKLVMEKNDRGAFLYVRFVRPDEFSPKAMISEDQVVMDYGALYAFSAEDSAKIHERACEIWEFLDEPEVREAIAGFVK